MYASQSIQKSSLHMQEVSHHGHLIKAYREQAGLTQEELASLIGRSRRTIITLEQGARIQDVKVRRTLAWALQIPHELLGLPALVLPPSTLRSPLQPPPETQGKHLSRVVFETLGENLRMRLDLYYLGSALGADQKLNDHIEHLTSLARHSSLKDRRFLLELLSHNYQLKGMIARDQLDYATADTCFKHASLVAQEAECPELHALSVARQATAELWRSRVDSAAQLYEIAADIAQRAPAALRTYLAAAQAEVQGTLGDERCLTTLTVAHTFLKRIDPDDDELLLFHSTRSSEQSMHDGWLNCHTLLGKPGLAIEKYDQLLEHKLDHSMTRMEARLTMQYAEALFAAKDMSCCFYATQGLKLARAVGSRRLFQRASELASKLVACAPHDERVKQLLQALHQY
jgi:DNA-binding XRE family transcriptional regulator